MFWTKNIDQEGGGVEECRDYAITDRGEVIFKSWLRRLQALYHIGSADQPSLANCTCSTSAFNLGIPHGWTSQQLMACQ